MLHRKSSVVALTFLLGVLLLSAGPAKAQYNAFKDPATSAAAAAAAAGLDFRAVDNDIKGGKITVGGTAYVVVLFKNQAAQAVKVGKVNLYPSSSVAAQVSLNQCGDAPLATDAQCAITVAITGKNPGSWRVDVLVDHDGRSKVSTASITGDVEQAIVVKQDQGTKGEVQAFPASLDFGVSPGGIALVKSITLSNHSGEDVEIWDIGMNVPDHSGFSFESQCPDTLLPDETCSIIVTWLPTTKGLAQGVLVVQHSGESGMTQAEVKGTLTPKTVTSSTFYPDSVPDRGLLVSDKEVVDFGSGIKEGASITLSLVNTGSSDLTLTNLRLSGSGSGLSLAETDTGCVKGTVLKPGEACPLAVNWSPMHEGLILDSLQVAHTGTRGILVVPIKGTADKVDPNKQRGSRGSSGGASRGGDMSRPGMGGTVTSYFEGGGKGTGGIIPGVGWRDQDEVLAALQDFSVTSHSATRAIINGPSGALVVRDGEKVNIFGTKWTVAIVSTGVILDNNKDKVVLDFDQSLKALAQPVADTAAGSSSTASTTATTAAATPAPAAAAAPATTTPVAPPSPLPSTTPPSLKLINP